MTEYKPDEFRRKPVPNKPGPVPNHFIGVGTSFGALILAKKYYLLSGEYVIRPDLHWPCLNYIETLCNILKFSCVSLDIKKVHYSLLN